MNKTLWLLPLLGFAATAGAQSSVTLAGDADASVQSVKGSTGTKLLLGSGGNATTKLRFRGTEDLGGGYSAGFWLETGLNIDTGVGTTSSTNNQPSGNTTAGGLVFGRRAIVLLTAPWGEVHLGRDWSPSYHAFTGAFDPFGVTIGIGLNYDGSPNRNHIRVSNAFSYVSPKVMGLFAYASAWRGENNPGAASSKDGNGGGMRVQYDNGGFTANAHFVRTTFVAGNAIYKGFSTFYNAGSFKVSFVWNRDAQAAYRDTGTLLGLWVPLGQHEFKASVSRIQTNTLASKPKGTKIAVGDVYSLSKRTALYGTYARITNNGGGNFAIAGATTAANKSSSGLEAGIRHSF